MGKGSIHSVILAHQTIKGVAGTKPLNKRWRREAKDPYDIIVALPRVGTNCAEKKQRHKDPARWRRESVYG